MKILAVYVGHNASVGLLENGRVVFCQGEERLNGIKNSLGFPSLTLEAVTKEHDDIDYAVFSIDPAQSYDFLKARDFKSVRYAQYFKNTKPLRGVLLMKLLALSLFPGITKKLLIWREEQRQKKYRDPGLRNEAIEYFASRVGLPKEKLIFLDHHTAHALSPCFNLDPGKPTLIFTLDGEGDGLCATVNIYRNGKLEELSKVSRDHSVGYLWHELAGFMGMRPNEDEYKIMGLAPYAKNEHSAKVKDKFAELLRLNDKDEFESAFPTPLSLFWYLRNMMYERFDNLSGGIQMFTEEIVSEWVRRWIKRTGISDIALSGGVFMNVKLNQKIVELPESKSVFIMPSCADESTVFGSMFHGYQRFCDEHDAPFSPVPFESLYLGQTYGDREIEEFIRSWSKGEFAVQKPESVEKEAARLLAKGDVVARYAGRMEFGARALGNRSIMANPSSYDNIRIINEMIKNRDFWMPFAPSILEEDIARYVKNPTFAPYMILTFDSTAEAQKDIPAAIHPYDFTTRPQVVRKEWNPEYHLLISEFKNLTGIGGILNTSFNLHGEPIVCKPADAVRVFENSGLHHLILGPYLISKPARLRV